MQIHQQSHWHRALLGVLGSYLVCTAWACGNRTHPSDAGNHGGAGGSGPGSSGLGGSGLGGTRAHDATAHGVVGFSFTVRGMPYQAPMRFNARVVGEDADFCALIVHDGYNEVRFSDLNKNCWAPEDGPVDTSRLASLQWHFTTTVFEAYDFCTCIGDLAVLTE